MTLYEIIKDIAQHSESVFMYSFDSINKNDDIHKLARQVKEIQNLDELNELNVFPLNRQIELNELVLSKVIIEEFGMKRPHYGLVCKCNGKNPFNELYGLMEIYSAEKFKGTYESVVAVNGLSSEECYHALLTAHCILNQFFIYKISNLVFMHYLCKCFEDKEFYCKSCLENMFLISFSEVPIFIEAIKQIRMKNTVNEKCLVLKKSNVRISDVFKSCYSSEIVKKDIAKTFSMGTSEVEALVSDMISIIKCFETEK